LRGGGGENGPRGAGPHPLFRVLGPAVRPFCGRIFSSLPTGNFPNLVRSSEDSFSGRKSFRFPAFKRNGENSVSKTHGKRAEAGRGESSCNWGRGLGDFIGGRGGTGGCGSQLWAGGGGGAWGGGRVERPVDVEGGVPGPSKPPRGAVSRKKFWGGRKGGGGARKIIFQFSYLFRFWRDSDLVVLPGECQANARSGDFRKRSRAFGRGRGRGLGGKPRRPETTVSGACEKTRLGGRPGRGRLVGDAGGAVDSGLSKAWEYGRKTSTEKGRGG